jgi:hypothetical protein
MMGPGWLRPELPDGPLRDLNDALHELHGRSGHRSSRFIAERLRNKHGTGAPSHSKVHHMFTRPELPRPELVLWVVHVLAETIRGLDPEAECDRFDHLWQLAFTRRGSVPRRPEIPQSASLADLDPAVWVDLFPDAVDIIADVHRTMHVNTIYILIGHYTTLVVVQRHLLGPDHPDTLTSRHNLAWWQSNVGEPGAGSAALEALLADRTRVLGHDHPHTLSTRLCIAYRLVMAGEMAKALATFKEVYSARERLLGTHHPDTLYTRRCVGWATGKAGNPQEAVAIFTEVLSRLSLVLDDEHPDMLTLRSTLAIWQSEAGHSRAALKALEVLLPVLVRVLGADHYRVLDIRRSIIYLRRARYGSRVVSGESNALLADMIHAMGAEHYDTNDYRAEMD